ncbi:MAG: hypothetical protein ABIK26_04315 [Candidatus Omnitrophota bacterium]
MKEKILISHGTEKNNESTKKTAVADNDASDTNRKIRKIPAQTLRDKVNTILKPGKTKLNALTAPKLVATPLPPLNFKKIGQLCPATTAQEAKRKIQLGEKGKSNLTKQEGKNPFKKSKINTNIPHFFPTTLKTFVAPILPEPKFLISIFPTK